MSDSLRDIGMPESIMVPQSGCIIHVFEIQEKYM